MDIEKVTRMKELEELILGSDKPIAEIALLKEYEILHSQKLAEEKAIAMIKSREMRNRRRRGKYGERRLAKEVGGRQDGRIGKKDVIAQGLFSFEVKTIKKIPTSIVKIMAQAERLKKKDTIAVGVFRCNSPRREFFIVERQDWLNLHGK